MDKESLVPAEDRRKVSAEASSPLDPSYEEIRAQRDRLLRERDALMQACTYLAERQGRGRQLKLAIRTWMMKDKG